MTNYELMYILDTAFDDEAKNAIADMVQKGVTDHAGVVDKVDVWGVKKLAYPIRKKNEGFYVVVDFQAGPDLPKELDRRLKISEACMRHIIVNKDEK